MIRWLANLFANLKALGFYGLILLIIVAVVMLSTLSISSISSPFDTAYQDMVDISTLNDDIKAYILEM